MYNPEHANFPRAGFFRRLGAMVYDLLLAIAVYVFCGTLGFGLFALLAGSGLIDMQGYGHLSDLLNRNPLYHGLYQLYLVICVASFYALFWSRGGQTLGMRAWRLKVQHPDGRNLSLITAYARIVWSLLGLGNLAILLARDKLALQDSMTRSEVVVLSQAANQLRNWHGA
ncbi:RDD family protein [Shewanella sp. NFH-SH190041]|uniref:RDD family protein n=1 Tax=Shewanella sp. NFH-SH190041 TaxID=2950245 RepID=UPI0021C35B21|nr:RDD family protein [Shewanella sp. NFH-SH190041]BDM63441.1 RDD family protein [Shewanella sp. NFH-SH190041]